MTTPTRISIAGPILGLVTVLSAQAGPTRAECTLLVSVASDGTQGSLQSWVPSISNDGRYVAFHALAPNLVPGDSNNDYDVFVHDRVTGVTIRVSVASDGAQGNGASSYASISADGRYVAFNSFATNLVLDDLNNQPDVFVHDRLTGVTTCVSVASDETLGNGASSYPSISADGRYVAFGSGSSNLVPVDTNGMEDIFVHDLVTGVTTRVSVASDGTQSNNGSWLASISADGRYVAFYSAASNLIPGDTNNAYDVFVHDCQTAATTRISVASDGTQGNNWSSWPSISADGRYVAFYSRATNLVPADTNARDDVFVHDRDSGTTTRVSVASNGTQGNGHSGAYGLAISPEGRYVAFDSRATNLVPGDTNSVSDVFLHDRDSGLTSRVSVASDGTQGNGGSDLTMNRSVSVDGRCVAFNSSASNLVPGDANGVADVFVRYRLDGCGLPGDLNCDGIVDDLDVGPFVLALVDPAGYAVQYPNCDLLNGDLDGDGAVTGLDIAAFVALVLGP